MIRQTTVCVAAVPLHAVAAMQQTIPAIMLAALCGVCCWLVFSNNHFTFSKSDVALFSASVAWCVVFALIVHPLLVIPAVLMVWCAVAPKRLWSMPAKARAAV